MMALDETLARLMVISKLSTSTSRLRYIFQQSSRVPRPII
jgi:hypothetical protein